MALSSPTFCRQTSNTTLAWKMCMLPNGWAGEAGWNLGPGWVRSLHEVALIGFVFIFYCDSSLEFLLLQGVVVRFTFYMAGLLCFWQFFPYSWQLSVLISPLEWQAITLRLWGSLCSLAPAVHKQKMLCLCFSVTPLVASSFWKMMPMQFLTLLLDHIPSPHRWEHTFA